MFHENLTKHRYQDGSRPKYWIFEMVEYELAAIELLIYKHRVKYNFYSTKFKIK